MRISPRKFTPMLGVHKSLNLTPCGRRLPPRYLPGSGADREFRISRSSQAATMDWISFKG